MDFLVFSLVIAVLTLFSLLLFIDNRKVRNQLSDMSEGNLNLIRESEEHKMKSIQLEAANQSVRELLENEKRYSDEKQKELKTQLELLGKNLVQHGSNVLKTENEQKINALLEPFKERLLAFEKEVRDTNKQEIERYASMHTVIRTLSEQHEKMTTTAQNLVDALRGEQKVQGDWGEMALERILESSGLEKNREYFVQNSLKNEEGVIFRPDVIVHLPDNKHLIIDAKVSLKAFEQYINADDELTRKTALAAHILSIKNHIKGLGEKDYSHLPGLTSPDFVLLFIPLESSFALAVKEEPGLYQQAWDKKIVIVTPSTLLASLKTIGSIWKQERQTRHALEIAEHAGRLYDKFVGFIQDMEKLGSKQRESAVAFDAAMNKLSTGSGNLIRSAEKLKSMGAKAKKAIDRKFLEADDDAFDVEERDDDISGELE
jgi:DNA recombination protein RmuC